jgi:hypothetical protein
MKTNDAKCIKAIEAATLPQKSISTGLDTFELSETFEEFLKHLPAESAGRQLAAITPDLKRSRPKGRGKTHPVKPEPHEMSGWFFIVRLMLGLNSRADYLISDAEPRLELAETITRLKGVLRVSNPNVRWPDAFDFGEYAALLVKARYNVTSKLCELRSLRLACEQISREYGEGHQLLHKSFSVKIEELHERALECAQEYQQRLKELLAVSDLTGADWPADLCGIDFEALDELAVRESGGIVRVLEASAEAQMCIAFDETPAAFEILNPYLQGGGNSEQD